MNTLALVSVGCREGEPQGSETQELVEVQEARDGTWGLPGEGETQTASGST